MQPNPPYQVLLRANVIPSSLCSTPFLPYSSLCVKLIPTPSIIITFCRFPSLLCSRHTLNRHHDISLSFETFLSQPSSCLSDQEGDDIYDFAGKYRSSLRHHQAKILMTPQGWVFLTTLTLMILMILMNLIILMTPQGWVFLVRQWRWWCWSCCFESDLSDCYNGSGRLKGGQEGRVRSHVHIWHLLNPRVLFGPAGCIVLWPL